MIRPGFLTAEDRKDLIALARDGSAANRLARRANAIVLLDDGWSCEQVSKAFFVDDDTVRTWFGLYQDDGLEGLSCFGHSGSQCRMTADEQETLNTWVSQHLPRSTREIGAFIEAEFGIVYKSRSGLVTLLQRLGFSWHRPKGIGRKLDVEEQKAFMAGYETLLNSLEPAETVVFVDAVHPTHAARSAGCRAPREHTLVLAQTSGRQRLDIHGALNLETGQTRMVDAVTIDAASTIRLFEGLEADYPTMTCIHVLLDNARYHHAKTVQEWLARPDCRIRLHFVPAYCPHLNAIERLWGLMHKYVTHNKCHATYRDFADAVLTFLRDTVPGRWHLFRDTVSDNFRIIDPKEFRVIN